MDIQKNNIRQILVHCLNGFFTRIQSHYTILLRFQDVACNITIHFVIIYHHYQQATQAFILVCLIFLIFHEYSINLLKKCLILPQELIMIKMNICHIIITGSILQLLSQSRNLVCSHMETAAFQGMNSYPITSPITPDVEIIQGTEAVFLQICMQNIQIKTFITHTHLKAAFNV